MFINTKDFIISILLFLVGFFIFIGDFQYSHLNNQTMTAVISFAAPVLFYFGRNRVGGTENLKISFLFGLGTYASTVVISLFWTIIDIFRCPQVTIESVLYIIIDSYTGFSFMVQIAIIITALIMGQIAGLFWSVVFPKKKEK